MWVNTHSGPVGFVCGQWLRTAVGKQFEVISMATNINDTCTYTMYVDFDLIWTKYDLIWFKYSEKAANLNWFEYVLGI